MFAAHQYRHYNSLIEIEIERWPKSITFYIGNSESYSEPSQTSNAEPFAKNS